MGEIVSEQQMNGSSDLGDYMLEEFKYHVQELLQKRRQGEVRINLFITIIGAVLGGTGFLIFQEGRATVDFIWPNQIILLFAYFIALFFGILTLTRIIRRNLDVEKEIRALNRIRRYFYEQNKAIFRYIRYEPIGDEEPAKEPYDDEPAKTWDWKSRKKGNPIALLIGGGLLEIVVFINSIVLLIIFFIIASIWLNLYSMVLIAIIGFLIGWIVQFCWVKRKFSRAKVRLKYAEFKQEQT